tara:strand:- start:49 stop:609 length:561 start_codon:yes stop_codon:yes gene_type:complete
MEVQNIIQESIKAKNDFVSQSENILRVSNKIIECFKSEGKLLIFGNGGSAADAQHIAAEFTGRFMLERQGLPAIALTTDSSVLTSISNDYDYSKVFERQVESLAKEGDVLLGISTSGNSENVVKAFEKGKEIGTVNISLTGKDGGKIKEISDLNVHSSSDNTARIQECHLLAYHIICEIVEKEMAN